MELFDAFNVNVTLPDGTVTGAELTAWFEAIWILYVLLYAYAVRVLPNTKVNSAINKQIFFRPFMLSSCIKVNCNLILNIYHYVNID